MNSSNNSKELAALKKYYAETTRDDLTVTAPNYVGKKILDYVLKSRKFQSCTNFDDFESSDVWYESFRDVLDSLKRTFEESPETGAPRIKANRAEKKAGGSFGKKLERKLDAENGKQLPTIPEAKEESSTRGQLSSKSVLNENKNSVTAPNMLAKQILQYVLQSKKFRTVCAGKEHSESWHDSFHELMVSLGDTLEERPFSEKHADYLSARLIAILKAKLKNKGIIYHAPNVRERKRTNPDSQLSNKGGKDSKTNEKGKKSSQVNAVKKRTIKVKTCSGTEKTHPNKSPKKTKLTDLKPEIVRIKRRDLIIWRQCQLGSDQY